MVQKILLLLVILASITVGVLMVLNRRDNSPVAISSNPTDTAKTSFHCGALVRPYGLKQGGADYSIQHQRAQFALLKELGASDVRANVETEVAVNDDFVKLATEYGLTATLIIEPTLNDFWKEASYQKAFTIAKGYAERYKGQVAYFQLANEASAAVIKPTFPGNKTTDYNELQYPVFKEWLRGLSDGVKAGAPSAKRIISANWLGVGIMDKLVQDKVDFEVAGWDWYSDMGTDLIKTMDDGTIVNIPEHIEKLGKELWVVEANRRQGTIDKNYAEQATFFEQFGKNVIKHKQMNGFFVFPLTDLCGELDKEHGNMGLVTLVKDSDGTCSIKDKKPAFLSVQSLIKTHK